MKTNWRVWRWSLWLVPLILSAADIHRAESERRHVLTGIDILEAEQFSPLHGLRVGLITNQTGRNHLGQRTLDLLRNSSQCTLLRVFSPEHGLTGNLDGKVGSQIDSQTGVTVYSLYGETRRPTPEMLLGLDILIFDMQDIGARFYTYITTMAYAMEAAGKAGIRFMVLDHPNPVTGTHVEGPVIDSDRLSFIGYFSLPVRHGMTIGELASLFKGENRLPVQLEVIRMQGWSRKLWLDETDLTWVNPSPNIRNLRQATLYTTTALLEATNVSVGRGTETPFEVIGAPWINSEELVHYLDARRIVGVQFTAAEFTPASDLYSGKHCQGIHLTVTDRNQFQSVACGLELAKALVRLYPGEFHHEELIQRIGSEAVVEGILKNQPLEELMKADEVPFLHFLQIRKKYLLYPE
ncbi:MAG: DUF1343 domain-containing protein [Terriglobia bacterium]